MHSELVSVNIQIKKRIKWKKGVLYRYQPKSMIDFMIRFDEKVY